MQEKVTVIFSIPLVKFLIHFFLVGIILSNIYFGYQSFHIQNQISNDSSKIESIQFTGSLTNDNNDYYASNIYKSKLYKEQGFKESGETIINLGLDERNPDPKDNQYLPKDIDTGNTSNLRSWINCIFFGRRLSLLNNSTDNNISNSFCK